MAKLNIQKYFMYKELNLYITKIDKQIDMYKQIKNDLFDNYWISPQSLYDFRSKQLDNNLEDCFDKDDAEYLLYLKNKNNVYKEK